MALTLLDTPAAPTEMGVFAPLVPNPTPETSRASNELIGGGTADAPAFQRVNGQIGDVPRAVPWSDVYNDPGAPKDNLYPAQLSKGQPSFGAFSDLVSTEAMPQINNIPQEFGMFADMVPPSPVGETQKAVDEISARDPALSHPPAETFWGTIRDNLRDMFTPSAAYDAFKNARAVSPEAISNLILHPPGSQIGSQIATAITGQTAPTGKVEKGVADAVGATVSGLTTPENVAILASMAGAPALISKAVSLGFGYQAAQSMYERSKALVGETDPGKIANGITSILLDGAIATAATVHGVTGLGEAVKTPEPALSGDRGGGPGVIVPAATTEIPPPPPIETGVFGDLVPKAEASSPENFQPSREAGSPVAASEPVPATTEPAAAVATTETPPASGEQPISQTNEPIAGDTAQPAQGGGENLTPAPSDIPTLRPGENQGDLLSKQTENLSLVGETGVDHGARQAESAAAEKARLQYEAEMQSELRMAGSDTGMELLRAVEEAGGMPSKASPHYTGEMEGIHSLLSDVSRKRIVRGINASKLIRSDSPSPDELTTRLRDRGFDFQTADDVRAAVERRLLTNQPVYGTSARELLNAEQAHDVFGFGPGAAAGGEFPTREPLSITHAAIDEARVKRGAPEIVKPLRQSDPVTWDNATARLDKNPTVGPALIDSVLDGTKKSTSAEERAMMFQEMIRVGNERQLEAERATRPDATPEEQADAEAAFNGHEVRLAKIEEAIHRTASASGSALRAQQLLAFDDYTLAALKTRSRSAKGRPLTLEEDTKLTEAHAEIERLKKQWEDAQDAGKRQEAMNVLDQLIKDNFKQAKADVKAGKTILDTLHASRDAARARQKARGSFGRLSAGIDPVELFDATIIGASHIADGLVEIGKWSEAMVREYGEPIREHLADLFERSKQYLGALKSAAGKKRGAAPKEQVTTAATEGKQLTQKMVFDLAREHVNAGIGADRTREGLDALMTAVHNDVKGAFPGVTPAEIRDIFTQYGKRTFPSKEADLTTLRAYNQIGKLVTSLDRVNAIIDKQSRGEDVSGMPRPEKSGMVRDKPIQTQRELMKDLRDKMREAGIETTSPEDQLASQNQARETALKNQIEDIQKEIATGEKRKPTPTSPDTPAVTALKATRDKLKATAQAIQDAKPEVIAEKERVRLEGEQRKLAKTIEGLKARQDGALPKPKSLLGLDRPAHPALEPLFQERDNLRAQIKQAGQDGAATAKVQRQLDSINDRIDEGLAKLSVGDKSARTKPGQVNRPFAPEMEAAQQQLEKVNAMMKEARKAPAKTEAEKAAARLANYKKALANRLSEVERRLRENDYSKPVRNKLALDNEATRARAAYMRERGKLDQQNARDQFARQNVLLRGLNHAGGLARTIAISGYHTLGKLFSFSVGKLVEAPLTETAGAIVEHIPGFRRITKKADLHYGSHIEGLAKFYSNFARKGMREAWSALRTGASNEAAIHGKMRKAPVHWYDFVGRIHDVEKTPIHTAASEMYRTKAFAAVIRAGLDPRDEIIRGVVNQRTFEYANWDKLQEANKFAEIISQGHARLEAVDPRTGHASIEKTLLSNAIKVIVTKDIIKTPANYLAQSLFQRGPVGLVRGVSKMTMAHIRGVEALTDVEANHIYRLMSLGLVGTAMGVWGAIDATKDPKDRIFGGYYQPGDKRGADDVKFGSIRVAGYSSHLLAHFPVLEMAQFGSTIVRVAGSLQNKRSGEKKGYLTGVLSASLAPLENAPIANPITRIVRHQLQNQTWKVGSDIVKGLIPQLVQNIAQDTDPNPDRRATNFSDEIKLAVPGLREQIQPKAAKGGSGSIMKKVGGNSAGMEKVR